jgi:hypothetical protein
VISFAAHVIRWWYLYLPGAAILTGILFSLLSLLPSNRRVRKHMRRAQGELTLKTGKRNRNESASDILRARQASVPAEQDDVREGEAGDAAP